MSLIVKNMNMPKNCMECELRFIARGLDTECIFSNDTVDNCTDRRLYRCPLVEIPSQHGRLIDADRFLDWIEEFHPNDVAIMSGVKNARTVVEAEAVE